MSPKQLRPWYKTVSSIRGPLLVVEKTKNVSYGELCKVQANGQEMLGQVLDTSKDSAVVQLFSPSSGVDLSAKVQFTGKPAQMGVGKNMIGKVFNGLGLPRENATFVPEKYMDVNGAAINPAARMSPADFIQTGVSTIDCMTTLVRGQKLPIFSASGLPHNELAAQIVRQANIKGGGNFVVIFAAMGITYEEANFFISDLRRTGALKRSVLFINLADEPSVERIITPRAALTAAEYLAFEKDMHVLVVLTDFTNYCEALREISSARSEVPGRRGYPGYMYTDLAAQYERAGMVKGAKGSITQIPIISMPAGDKTHPIPDLTGYITEGQVVLDNALHSKGSTPPVNPLPSLSRLMNAGVGKGKTREDHKGVADQLFASYAQGLELRQLVSVIGESSLSDTDKKYLEFARRFEKEFIDQGFTTNRTIEQTLNIGWRLLKILPMTELKKVKQDHIKKYMP